MEENSKDLVFDTAKEKFNKMLEKQEVFSTAWLNAMESEVGIDGRELICHILQGYIDSRGDGNIGKSISTKDGSTLTHRRLQSRTIQTLYGKILIDRMGYSFRDHENVFPLDASLNLPISSSFSFGLQRFIARRVAISAFSDVLKLTHEVTGAIVGQPQAIKIAENSALDFDDFYASRKKNKNKKAVLLVLTTDAKGIVMRQDSLTEATQKKALAAAQKMKKRLSKGEKSNRKRMAQVASVYFIDKFIRTPKDILNDLKREKANNNRPRPFQKRVWASVEKESTKVLDMMFQEALNRDPKHKKEWIVLIDGNRHQLQQVELLSEKNKIKVVIILDIIHVIEYLWNAARAFVNEEDYKNCEAWVNEKLDAIMRNKSSNVVITIRRSISMRKLKGSKKEAAENCANYLANHKEYMQYGKYLKQGYPIATGVIEGACRYLIKDRMDITGARWGLSGAESILKLRSLVTSGDFDEYWKFHLNCEYERNYASKIDLPEKFKSLTHEL